MEQQSLSERFFTAIGDMRRYLMQAKPLCGISHSEMPILHLIDYISPGLWIFWAGMPVKPSHRHAIATQATKYPQRRAKIAPPII